MQPVICTGSATRPWPRDLFLLPKNRKPRHSQVSRDWHRERKKFRQVIRQWVSRNSDRIRDAAILISFIGVFYTDSHCTA